MINTQYWLHGDSKTAIKYLEEYHYKWSIFSTSPFRQAWLRNFLAYYSPVINPGSWDTSLIFDGIQGELIRMFTPKARTLVRQLVTIATKQRLSFQAIAETSGSDVIKDVKLANALADQIVMNERLDQKGDSLVEGSIVTGNWFTKATWRTDRGNPYTRGNQGELIYTGAAEISLSSVFDTFYDISYSEWQQVPWVEVRTQKVRWDLIAQFPDLEREIRALPSAMEARGTNTWFDRTMIDEDSVFVYEMYARPCPSLPEGRMVIYSDDQTCYYDGINPYGTVPVEPMMPEGVMTSGIGYPQFSNITAPQEMYDNCISSIATNNAAFAVQNVAVARGANINVNELNGMRFISFTPQNVPGGGVPQPLQLTQTAPETFKFAEMLGNIQQDLFNINGALRGTPPPGVTSGVAIATLSANSLEFTQNISRAYQQCMEKTMMHAVNAYKKFGKLESSVMLNGKNNQVVYQKFKGVDDLKNISGVKILVSNPLMQTVAGRIEVAEKLLALPKEYWPKYVSILEGRPLQDIYKGDLSQEDLIDSEDELLLNGKQTPVLATDDHGLHVQSHAALLNDPLVRSGNSSMEIILQHIEEHKNLSQMTDPYLMAMVRTGKVPMGQTPPASPLVPPQNAGEPLAEQTLGRAEPAQDALQRGGR